MTNVIHHNFRKRRPVNPYDEALAMWRLAQLRAERAMEAAERTDAEIEAVARRMEEAQKEQNNGR